MKMKILHNITFSVFFNQKDAALVRAILCWLYADWELKKKKWVELWVLPVVFENLLFT